MDKQLLSILQLCDSNFPTGAFSHSYGLETYIQENKVHDADSFLEWLQIYLNEQLIHSDGLACKLIYEALEMEQYTKVWKLDRMLMVQNLPRETREGSKRIGESMAKLIQSLYDFQVLNEYAKRIKSKQSFGHPAVVFSMIGHHLCITPDSTILYYLYSAVSGIVQNAVRAIPLGQTAGQKIIHSIQDSLVDAVTKIREMEEEDFGIVSPGLELSQMLHERVNIRIFMS
ncbi:urease accessory protein UreF [Bacillus sp. S/N-304-OC-R1]|uniref:urease accessory protein UreF n=1 Tax=Bacillus sp. S/N-304-OC-R1 TaxID=2758034 RepID=UPI001C8E4545|nr:urease accessory protein UreF [Bacillus sp. S/N-304-OC-R1]MBY0120396.1 urease accessory protein UreF [Bacillus sp. S/N-304-OC-R1]